MTKAITGITNDERPVDPFARWVAAFEVAYALTETSIDQLNQPGILRTDSGLSLQVRKITRDMLKNDLKLAGEIHALATQGHVGFINSGKIGFRKDVAEKIGMIGGNRTFKVVNFNPAEGELLNAEVRSLDDDAYSLLAGVKPISEASVIAKENPEENGITSETSDRSTRTVVSQSAEKKQKFSQWLKNVGRNIALNILKHVRITEKQRAQIAKEKREEQKELKREQIKKDVLHYEIEHREREHTDSTRIQIKKTEEIARQNDGLPKK